MVYGYEFSMSYCNIGGGGVYALILTLKIILNAYTLEKSFFF